MRLSKPQKKLWSPTPDEAKTFTTGDVGHAGLTRHTPHNRATRALPYTIPPSFPYTPKCCLFPNHTITALYRADFERDAVIERFNHLGHGLAFLLRCSNLKLKLFWDILARP